MPDSYNRRDADYAQYDAMSTEELQQLLREDASKPEGEETNMEVLLYVMDVLAKRRQARNEGRTPEEALESFMQNYFEEDDKSSGSESNSNDRKHSPGFRRWMSGLIAAAAMFVLIIGSSLTASALGFDLWDVIVKWTQETFHFGYATDVSGTSNPNKNSTEVFAGLQDALNDYDITTSLVPTWLPEGYEEVIIRVEDTPRRRQFAAQYQFGDKTIRIRIADYFDNAPTHIEQSDSLIEIYSASGVNYYIFDNEGQLQALWLTENYECYISGPLSISELKEIIDSIGKDE